MKKFILLPLFALLFLVSCSKSAKLNRDLNGSWNLKTINGSTSFNGLTVGTNFTQVITFTKDAKDNGSYSVVTTVSPAPAQTENGTYTLVDDTKLIKKATNSTTSDTATVVSYDKSSLKIMSGSYTYEYSKK